MKAGIGLVSRYWNTLQIILRKLTYIYMVGLLHERLIYAMFVF